MQCNSGHEHLEEIVEEAPAKLRRRDALVVARDEAAALGVVERREHRGDQNAGTLFEQRHRKAVVALPEP